MIACHIAIGETLCRHKTLVALFEFFHFPLFISKGFYHADPCQAVLNLAVDIRNAGAVFLESTFHPFVVKQGIKSITHTIAPQMSAIRQFTCTRMIMVPRSLITEMRISSGP